MDSPDFPTGAAKSPRTLHGPRPAPLRLRKDSHKIRKPPVPPPQHHRQPPQIPPQYRPPVIIYTVSPKVIHTNPTEFMNLVQRLTGPSAASPVASAFRVGGGDVSPAARFASLEKAAKSPEGRKVAQNGDVAVVEGVEINTSGYFPGILSPGPASLPPIPPNFFSPLGNDQNPLSFFQDLSPAFHNDNTRNFNYFEGNINNNSSNNNSNSFVMPSPSNLLLSPYFVSPTTLDLFNTLFD